MAKGKTRALIILTGVACLVIAGWIGVEQFVTKEDPEISDPKVQISKAQLSGANSPKKDSRPRSLEELKKNLREAQVEWASLQNQRYFFEDYADEIVMGFTLEEIQLLARELVELPISDQTGFENAILKRWGELEQISAFAFLDSISSEVLQLGGTSLSQLSAKKKQVMKCAGRYFLVSEGWSRRDPVSCFEEMEHGGLSKKLSRLNLPLVNFEVFSNLCRFDPLLARKIAMSKSSKGKWVRAHSTSLVSANDAVIGYLGGLPENSNWKVVAETFVKDFQEDGLNNYPSLLARWIAVDQEASLDWFRITTETVVVKAKWPKAGGPSEDDTPHINVVADSHDYEIGQAVGDWIRQAPKNGLEWIKNHKSELSPELYAGALFGAAWWDSPAAFAEIVNIIKTVDDHETRGKALLLFDSEAFSFKELLAEPKWARSGEIESLLRDLKLSEPYSQIMDRHLLPSR